LRLHFPSLPLLGKSAFHWVGGNGGATEREQHTFNWRLINEPLWLRKSKEVVMGKLVPPPDFLNAMRCVKMAVALLQLN